MLTDSKARREKHLFAHNKRESIADAKVSA